MKIAWCTDIHLNFVTSPSDFGRKISGVDPDAVLITGDISECYRLSRDLLSLRDGIGDKIPIWFVLGNHDSYQGSVTQAKNIAGKMSGLASNLIYIGNEEHKCIEIVKDTWLIGVDGWYSATAGIPFESEIQLSDFSLVSEMVITKMRDQRDMTAGRVAAARRLASTEAELAKVKLTAVLKKNPKKVIVATHVPPYVLSCFHEGKISDENWLPWFTNTLLGDVLDSVAKNNPKVLFDVFCGHTHSSGIYHRSDNVTVTVGAARYVIPSIAAVMEF